MAGWEEGGFHRDMPGGEPWMAAPSGYLSHPALPLVLMEETPSGVGRVASSWPAPKRGTGGLHRAS